MIAIFAVVSVLDDKARPDLAEKFEVAQRCSLGRPNGKHRLMNFDRSYFRFLVVQMWFGVEESQRT